MVYNSARCKMKRCVFFVIGVMIALVFASGCSKDVIVTQSKVHEFTINFSNVANKQTVTEGYAELKGVVSSSDAVSPELSVSEYAIALPIVTDTLYLSLFFKMFTTA